jgi:MFS family permease
VSSHHDVERVIGADSTTASGHPSTPLEAGANTRVLVSAALGSALTPLNSTMVAVALPALSRDFAAPASRVTLTVITGYLIATLLAQLPAGRVADRVGYVRALAWGRWLFAAGAVVGTFAPSLWIVVGGRLLMAAGGALIIPTAMALVRVAVPASRRSRAFGTLGAVLGGAAAIGPAIGAWMVAQFGWRSLFVINVPILLASAALQPRIETDAAVSRRSAGADYSSLRTRGFLAGSGVIAIQNLAMYSLLILVPFMFGSRGGSDSRLGLAIIGMTATMALVSPVGGWLVESIGARAVVVAGGVIGTAGVLSIAQLAPTAVASAIGARLLLVGLGLGLSTGPSQAVALTAVPSEQSGLASATVSMLRYLGAIGGTGILSFTLAGGQGDMAREQMSLWIFAGAFVLSAVLGAMFPSMPSLRARSSARA